jgi:hypothetical protein
MYYSPHSIPNQVSLPSCTRIDATEPTRSSKLPRSCTGSPFLCTLHGAMSPPHSGPEQLSEHIFGGSLGRPLGGGKLEAIGCAPPTCCKEVSRSDVFQHNLLHSCWRRDTTHAAIHRATILWSLLYSRSATPNIVAKCWRLESVSTLASIG